MRDTPVARYTLAESVMIGRMWGEALARTANYYAQVTAYWRSVLWTRWRGLALFVYGLAGFYDLAGAQLLNDWLNGDLPTIAEATGHFPIWAWAIGGLLLLIALMAYAGFRHDQGLTLRRVLDEADEAIEALSARKEVDNFL